MVNLYLLILSLLVMVIVVCCVSIMKKRTTLNKKMTVMMLAAILTIVSNIVYVSSDDEMISMFGFSMFSLMIDWLLLSVCIFIEEYTYYSVDATLIKMLFIILSMFDSISLLLNLIFKHVYTIEPVMLLDKYEVLEAGNFTVFYYVHLAICYILVIYNATMLVYGFINSSGYYKRKYSGVLILFGFLIIADGLCVLFHMPLNISIIFYVAMLLAIYFYTMTYIPRELVGKVQNLMIEHLGSGLVFFDEMGKKIYCNDSQFMHKGDRKIIEMIEQDFDTYFDRIKTLDGDYNEWNESISVDGQMRHFLVSGQKLYDSTKSYVGCYFSTSDRTDQVRLYERKINMEIESNKAKSAFLSKVSHEIRTPVNSVYGMNEMILRECEDVKILQYANQIKSATDTLIGIINEILDFSKIEAGKMEIVEREYHIEKLLHNVSNMIRVKAEEKKLKFIVEVADNIPSILTGDDVRIEQILMNLLSNAVKYTNEGSVTLKVEWRGADDNGALDIYVKDTGIGIMKSDIPKLFNEYERIEEARNHSVQGTGLGLNITSHLLELMGSKLQVESEYGKGTTFFCNIPQKIVDKTPVVYEENNVSLGIKSDYKPAFTAPNATILLVDDNRLNRIVFRNLLKQTLVNVVEADSGKACLELIKDRRFDLIFMDYMMPEMDGVETFEKMNYQDHMNVGVPVIMLTANASKEDMRAFGEQGFADCLSKPVIPEVLEEMIRKYLVTG